MAHDAKDAMARGLAGSSNDPNKKDDPEGTRVTPPADVPPLDAEQPSPARTAKMSTQPDEGADDTDADDQSGDEHDEGDNDDAPPSGDGNDGNNDEGNKPPAPPSGGDNEGGDDGKPKKTDQVTHLIGILKMAASNLAPTPAHADRINQMQDTITELLNRLKLSGIHMPNEKDLADLIAIAMELARLSDEIKRKVGDAVARTDLDTALKFLKGD